MPLLLVTLLALQITDVPETIRTKDGKSMRGTFAGPAIKLRTSFGEATFEVQKIHSIEFGDPDVVIAKDQAKLQGSVQFDELTLTTDNGRETLRRSELASIYVDQGPAVFEPGKIVDGTARNHVTYHVRVPADFDPARELPAIVILHGSNMNSKAYVATIVAAWPKLAEDYIIVGINGEYRIAQSPPGNPAYNYSGVNYMGKSKYKG